MLTHIRRLYSSLKPFILSPRQRFIMAPRYINKDEAAEIDKVLMGEEEQFTLEQARRPYCQAESNNNNSRYS